MTTTSFLLTLYFFMVATSIYPPLTVALGNHHHLRLVPTTTTTTTTAPCLGSMEECIADGELVTDSESHRRILATSQYISYKALQRNTVPCTSRGASYYNCKPGASANPYSRGCNTITRCRTA